MKNLSKFCLLVILLTKPGEAVETVDLSSDLAGIIKGTEVPALAAAAAFQGEIVSAGATGIRKAGFKEPVTLNDKWHIGSCTKSMTAVLAAILVEQEKLKWETTVSEAFPEIEIHEDYRKVTLTHLLTNTGGTPNDIEANLWSTLWKAKGSARDQRMQLVKGTLSQQPDYPPGSKNLYSNTGFSIAGAMMENIVDRPYETLLSEFLFKPLDMKSAGFRAPATNGRIDQPYGHRTGKAAPLPRDPEPAGDNPRAIAPAGGVHCSIIDLAKYARFHLGRTDPKLISRQSLQVLHTPAEGRNYAMGWVVTERTWAGGTTLTHTGSNTMFYAVIWLAPERDFAAVAMCNLGGQDAFAKCDQAIALLIKKHLPPESRQ